jgi:hypothetical protein
MVRSLMLAAGLLLVTSALVAQPPSLPFLQTLLAAPAGTTQGGESVPVLKDPQMQPPLDFLQIPQPRPMSPYPCCDNCLSTWRTCTTYCGGNSSCEATCDINYNNCILGCCGSHCPPMYCPL